MIAYIEINNVGLEVEIEGEYDEGEPMVMYYRDGSGYPGSADHFYYHNCHVRSANGEGWEYKRSEKPEYFEALDKLVDNHITLNLEEFENQFLENFYDQ